MKELTEQVKWALGKSAAEKLFNDITVKEFFQQTCDLWFKSRSLYKPLDWQMEDTVRSLIYRVLGTVGCIPFFDETYTERIWIQRFNLKENRLDNLFYYDCFYGKFVAFGEVE